MFSETNTWPVPFRAHASGPLQLLHAELQGPEQGPADTRGRRANETTPGEAGSVDAQFDSGGVMVSQQRRFMRALEHVC
jgi:hypothetical protein